METVLSTCPACGATAAPNAPWCTLCFASLSMPKAPEPVTELPAPTEPAYAVGSDPIDSTATIDADPADPDDPDAALARRLDEAFEAARLFTPSRPQHPFLDAAMNLSPAQRVVAGFVGMVVFSGLLLGLLAIAGLFIH